MHQGDIGDETFPAAPAPTGTPSYVSVGAGPTMLLKLVTTSLSRLLQSRNVELTHHLFQDLEPRQPNRALFIQEINRRGYIKQFEPEFFFMKLTGDQTLANRLADYWRQSYSIPTVHPGSPFDLADQQHVHCT